MGSSIKIGFAGSYKCDLLLYFSRIAAVAGKKVMLVDSTDEQLLTYSIPDTAIENIVTYNNCDIFIECKDIDKYNQLEFDKYDIALIDYGFNKKFAKHLIDCNEVIIVTDLERHNVLKTKEFLEYITKTDLTDGREKLEVIKIYRDIVKSKIDTKYIEVLLNCNPILEVKGEYLFYFDEVDYRLRIESQYNDNFKFNKLMKEHRLMFMDILE